VDVCIPRTAISSWSNRIMKWSVLYKPERTEDPFEVKTLIGSLKRKRESQEVSEVAPDASREHCNALFIRIQPLSRKRRIITNSSEAYKAPACVQHGVTGFSYGGLDSSDIGNLDNSVSKSASSKSKRRKNLSSSTLRKEET